MAARITPEQKRQIERMRAEGHTLTATAKKLGIDRHSCRRHIDSLRGEPTATPPPVAAAASAVQQWPDETWQRLAGLLRAVEVGECDHCGELLVVLRTQGTGLCPLCNRWWVTAGDAPWGATTGTR
jgi:hypothetical protein